MKALKIRRVYEAPKLLQPLVVRKPVVIEVIDISAKAATLALFLKPGPPTIVILTVGSAATVDWDLTIAPELGQ